ncbi:hypothetical protein FG386_000342 [Cryptosporidium ryanae]|uniref:uncharacterized protein n=1 Tax=Cryptosporidium ryanae TaxID=515981 RepID=UPI00351A37FC|nr:hypothetical protein FG386_000342 [Cryptosporidium ryanae]
MFSSHIPISPSLRSKYVQSYKFDQSNTEKQNSGEHDVSGSSFFDNPVNPHEELGNSYRDSYRDEVIVAEDMHEPCGNNRIVNSRPQSSNINVSLEERNTICSNLNTTENYFMNIKYMDNSTNASDRSNERRNIHGLPPIPSLPQSNKINDMNSYVSFTNNQSHINNRHFLNINNSSSVDKNNDGFKIMNNQNCQEFMSIGNDSSNNNFVLQSPHPHSSSPRNHTQSPKHHPITPPHFVPTTSNFGSNSVKNHISSPIVTHIDTIYNSNIGPPSIAAPIGPPLSHSGPPPPPISHSGPPPPPILHSGPPPSPISHSGPSTSLKFPLTAMHKSIPAPNSGQSSINTQIYPQIEAQNSHNVGPVSSTSHYHPPQSPKPHVSSQNKHPNVPFLDTSKMKDLEEEQLNSLSSSSISKKMQNNRERLEQLNISHSKFGLTGILKQMEDRNEDLNNRGNIPTEDTKSEKNNDIMSSENSMISTLLINESPNLQNKSKYNNTLNHRLPPKAPKTGKFNSVPFGVNNMLMKQKSEELHNVVNKSDKNDSFQYRDTPLTVRPPTAPTFCSREENSNQNNQGSGLNNRAMNGKLHVNSDNVDKLRDSMANQLETLQRPPTAPNTLQKHGNLPKVDMLISLMGKTVENKRKDFEKLNKLKNVLSELGDFNKRLLEENTRLKSGNLVKNNDVKNPKEEISGIKDEFFSQINENKSHTNDNLLKIDNNSTCLDHISHINSLKTIINKKNQRISELERRMVETKTFNGNNINYTSNNNYSDLCYDLLDKLKVRDEELINNLNDINKSNSGIIVEKLSKCVTLLEEKRNSSKLRILINDISNQIEFNYKALSVTIEHLIYQQNSTLESINNNVFTKEEHEDSCNHENNLQGTNKSQNIQENMNGSKPIETNEKQNSSNINNFLGDEKTQKFEEENTLNQSQASFDYSNENDICGEYNEENQIEFEENERNNCLKEFEYEKVSSSDYYNNMINISNNTVSANEMDEYQYNNVKRELSLEEIGYQYEPKIEQFSVDWLNNNNVGIIEESELRNCGNYYQANNNESECYGNGFVNEAGASNSYINNQLQYQAIPESTSSVPPSVLAAYYENSSYQGGENNYENSIGGNEGLVMSDNTDYRYYQVPASLSNI